MNVLGSFGSVCGTTEPLLPLLPPFELEDLLLVLL